MTFRISVLAPAWFTLLWLGVSAPALAQSEPAAKAGGAQNAGDEDDAEGEEAENGDQDTAKKDAEPAPALPPETPSAAASATPAAQTAARQQAVSLVGVELLPDSAYPEPRPRGIVGGSLWMNMHGLQWPYMPMLPGGPKTRLGFSGSAWVDFSAAEIEAGLADAGNDENLLQWLQESRAVLRATPSYSTDRKWFVQGQAELVANSDQTNPRPTTIVDTDDLWVRVGKWDVFDIQAGRFQGWEIYHLGMGLDQNTFERIGAKSVNNTPVGLYGVTYFWDRPTGAGKLAGHIYPTDFLRFELLGQAGNDGGRNMVGVRPVGILDFGFIKLKGGAEYGKYTARQQGQPVCMVVNNVQTCRDEYPESTERRGFGGALQFVLAPYVEFGGSVAHGLVDEINREAVLDLGRSTTTTSYGGFANGRIIGDLLVGGGATYTYETNLNQNAVTLENDFYTHLQVYGALQYALWQQLYIKAVVAYSEAGFNPMSNQNPVPFTNTMLSGRLRLMVLF
jgi:hypothetical protein